MIKLNKHFPIGMRVTIPARLSWQVADAEVAGDYTVKSILDDDYIVLCRITDSNTLIVDTNAISYLSGSYVSNPPMWTAIDSSFFQPDKSDVFNYNYFTEDNVEFGFWYCGWLGASRCITVQLLTQRWCYGEMPWD